MSAARWRCCAAADRSDRRDASRSPRAHRPSSVRRGDSGRRPTTSGCCATTRRSRAARTERHSQVFIGVLAVRRITHPAPISKLGEDVIGRIREARRLNICGLEIERFERRRAVWNGRDDVLMQAVMLVGVVEADQPIERTRCARVRREAELLNELALMKEALDIETQKRPYRRRTCSRGDRYSLSTMSPSRNRNPS